MHEFLSNTPAQHNSANYPYFNTKCHFFLSHLLILDCLENFREFIFLASPKGTERVVTTFRGRLSGIVNGIFWKPFILSLNIILRILCMNLNSSSTRCENLHVLVQYIAWYFWGIVLFYLKDWVLSKFNENINCQCSWWLFTRGN